MENIYGRPVNIRFNDNYFDIFEMIDAKERTDLVSSIQVFVQKVRNKLFLGLIFSQGVNKHYFLQDYDSMYPANGGDTFLQNAGNQPKISNFYKT